MSEWREDPLGYSVLVGWALLSVPYNVVRHPVKTYRLVVHGIGWYER